MDQPVTFTPLQINQEGIQKLGEISSAFTTLHRNVIGTLGNTPDTQIVAMKLEEAWLYVNKALVTANRGRVAA